MAIGMTVIAFISVKRIERFLLFGDMPRFQNTSSRKGDVHLTPAQCLLPMGTIEVTQGDFVWAAKPAAKTAAKSAAEPAAEPAAKPAAGPAAIEMSAPKSTTAAAPPAPSQVKPRHASNARCRRRSRDSFFGRRSWALL
jgi:hypothetical protein